MARMSDCAQDLESIHNILLGQRQVAQNALKSASWGMYDRLSCRIECINDLLLEFEAAGVVWPGNVVSLEEHITACVGPAKNTVTAPSGHPEDGVSLSRIDRFKLKNGCPLI